MVTELEKLKEMAEKLEEIEKNLEKLKLNERINTIRYAYKVLSLYYKAVMGYDFEVRVTVNGALYVYIPRVKGEDVKVLVADKIDVESVRNAIKEFVNNHIDEILAQVLDIIRDSAVAVAERLESINEEIKMIRHEISRCRDKLDP